MKAVLQTEEGSVEVEEVVANYISRLQKENQRLSKENSSLKLEKLFYKNNSFKNSFKRVIKTIVQYEKK